MKKNKKKFPAWDKQGFVFSVGFVMAILVSILIFIGLTSGSLKALYGAGKTFASVINIFSAIPPILWVFIGIFFLILLMRRRR